MGCTDSRPSEDVYNVVFPINPDIPVIGAKKGAEPSKEGPMELVLFKDMFKGEGGHSFMIKTRDADKKMAEYCNLAVKGKEGGRDQMDVIDKTTKEPVAVVMRDRVEAGVHSRLKIYTPVPLFEGQKPTLSYEGDIPLYIYARVHQKNEVIISVWLDNQDKEDKPAYTCRVDSSTRRYIYKDDNRQCAFLQVGSANSIIAKMNAGVDPCLIICLTACIDEMS